ncbi:MAG: gluconolaconase, partial [Sphingomonadales bacterium]|nr:gluconolaconase [Sphingomonadales bacterium]
MAAPAAASDSVFATRPDDPAAITVDAKGDGRTDDTAAIQAAIDAAASRSGDGIVFLPSGRYRLTRTLFVWPGVRLFGVGATRPVFVLGDNTPGFQKGVATMIIFAGANPNAKANARLGRAGKVPFPPPDSVPFNPNISDANSGTFYSAMSNVDFAIGAGNSAAIGVRFHAAQHAYLSHIY